MQKRNRKGRIRTQAEKEATRERNARRKREGLDEYRVGVDGEGIADENGKHLYVMLQWSDASGRHKGSLVDPKGLDTVRILDFLLAIPLGAKSFAFAFNYDLTKILVDLPDEVLYRLFRPELRPGEYGPKAVYWRGYKLNLLGTKFSVRKGNRRRVIWDLFRFYQKRFTRALSDWDVCPPDVIKRIEAMKEKREAFTLAMLPDMSRYCFEECAYLATLVEKLDEAHERAGIELPGYYGAGSTASGLLKSWGIKDVRRDAGEQTEAMREAVASAFFGGRFENSIVGVVQGPLFNYDICSAYPYQLRFLPCLDHGSWVHSHDRQSLEQSSAALVEYSLDAPRDDREWAPFPFRTIGGSIVFPSESAGGWVWKDEYLAGERLFPNVNFLSAWVYQTDCDCVPFKKVPEVYLRRLELGKDGAGIVLKLGPNSCYGKLAQAVGKPQFQSWIWAGMITSGTRAQLLSILELLPDWSQLYAMATDSVLLSRELDMPSPRDTGTSVLLDGTPNKPSKRLGAWDKKVEERPTFIARPGIYFPLNPKEEDLELIRARGIGRRELYNAGHKLVEAWERGQYDDISLGTIRRFCGAKTSTHSPTFDRQGFSRADSYGQWVDRPVCASLNPLPKRQQDIERDGDIGRLTLRSFRGERSSPYKRALSVEALELKAMTEESQEQPEGMYSAQFDDDEFELAPGQ